MWVLHGGKCLGRNRLTSRGSFGSPAEVAVRTDPAFVITGLFMRCTFTEPLMCVRLRPGHCEHLNEKSKHHWTEVRNTGLSVCEA